MWVRQCDLDAQAEAPSPIPTRIASNLDAMCNVLGAAVAMIASIWGYERQLVPGEDKTR